MSGQQGREVVIVEAVRTPVGPRAPREGLLQGHPPRRPAGQDLHGGARSRRRRPRRGRGRHRGLRAAVRRAGLQRRAQRLAAGGAADRGGRDDRRPPVRLGAAGRELRRRAHRRRHPRRGHRLRRRAHGPPALRRGDEDPAGVRRRLHRQAHGEAQHRRPGPGRRDDRRPVGDPALRARRARAALAPARRQGDRGGQVRARDRPLPGQRRHLRVRPGHPPRHLAGGARLAQAGVQGGRAHHGRQLVADLRRRRRGAAHVAREGR